MRLSAAIGPTCGAGFFRMAPFRSLFATAVLAPIRVSESD